ncbi:MAG: zinc-ribbon and DUF3426 domain-containing protein [Pseudomonadota bacterium]
MQTRCPQCRTLLEINADQLQHGQRQVKCAHCDSTFDALAALTDESEAPDEEIQSDVTPPPFTPLVSPEPEEAEPPATEHRRFRGPLPWEPGFETQAPRYALWGFGIVLLFMLLAGQVYIFEGERLAQSERIRPWLIKLCKPFNCTLPIYNNISGIDVIDRSLTPLPGGGLEFHALFVNNSEFPQALPLLKLTLLSFTGSPYAERIFTPDEYLAEKPVPTELPVGRPVKAQMHIAAPTGEIGGYTFEFIATHAE